MCIICNMRNEADVYAASDFLAEFKRANSSMRKAAAALLDISKRDLSAGDRKRYDRAHKRMVRVIRDWNRIEHLRESGRIDEIDGVAHRPLMELPAT